MPKKDDALPLRHSTPAKGPTAEELSRQVPQKTWLDKNINWGRLRRFAYIRTGDPTIGGEIVQEVYNNMCLWSLEELTGRTNPKGYVFVSIRNRIYKWKKRQSRFVPLPDDFENLSIDERSPEHVLEDQDYVVSILGMVQDEWRVPWVLHRHEGLKYEEVAQRLGLSIDAVKKRVRRADALLVMLVTTPPEPSIISRVKEFFKHKDHRDAK
jgi:RNA polymerase sigma-70 factor (ECF subfamily)